MYVYLSRSLIPSINKENEKEHTNEVMDSHWGVRTEESSQALQPVLRVMIPRSDSFL